MLKPGVQENPSRNLYKEVAVKVIEQHNLSDIEKRHLYYEIQVIKFIHKHPGVISVTNVSLFSFGFSLPRTHPN